MERNGQIDKTLLHVEAVLVETIKRLDGLFFSFWDLLFTLQGGGKLETKLKYRPVFFFYTNKPIFVFILSLSYNFF